MIFHRTSTSLSPKEQFLKKFGSSPDCKKASWPILGNVHRVLASGNLCFNQKWISVKWVDQLHGVIVPQPKLKIDDTIHNWLHLLMTTMKSSFNVKVGLCSFNRFKQKRSLMADWSVPWQHVRGSKMFALIYFKVRDLIFPMLFFI